MDTCGKTIKDMHTTSLHDVDLKITYVMLEFLEYLNNLLG